MRKVLAKTPELLPLVEKSRFPTNRPPGQKPAPGARLGFRGCVLWGAASPWLFADGEEGSETNFPQELVRAQPACQLFLLQPRESSDDWERMGLKHLRGGRLLEAHLKASRYRVSGAYKSLPEFGNQTLGCQLFIFFKSRPETRYGLPRWCGSEESACRCRRRGFDPWVRKRKWQPTPNILSWEIPWMRNLAGYSPWGHRVGHN